MSKLKSWIGGLLVALLAVSGIAYAQGIYPGYPAATSIAGNYWWAADTALPGGMAPQTVGITADQMKNYVFGGSAEGTVTATGSTTANIATLNAGRGKVTSTALTNAANALTTFTITNSAVLAGSIVLGSVALGTATTGEPTITSIAPGTGSVVVTVKNTSSTAAAFNGTIVVSYVVLQP